MAAPQKVSTEAIRDALTRWGGNVTATASDLGISPNALYARIERAGIRVEEIRTHAAAAAIPIKTRTRVQPLRVPADVQERIRGARFDLCARFRQEFTDEAVLAAFVAEALDAWVAAKMERKS